jgi:hypothetical protein
MGLSFTISAGPCQRSHSLVRFPCDSRPYFTVSDSRLPFSSPLMTRRATVEVFDPASTRDLNRSPLHSSLCSLARIHGNCWLLVRIRGNRSWIFFDTKRFYRTVAQQWIIPSLFVAAGKCVGWAVGKQWTSTLAPLFRLPGAMSQYDWMALIQLVKNRVQWRDNLNTTMNLRLRNGTVYLRQPRIHLWRKALYHSVGQLA